MALFGLHYGTTLFYLYLKQREQLYATCTGLSLAIIEYQEKKKKKIRTKRRKLIINKGYILGVVTFMGNSDIIGETYMVENLAVGIMNMLCLRCNLEGNKGFHLVVQRQDLEPSQSLLLRIFHMHYPITEDVLHPVFDGYGFMESGSS